MIFAGFMLIDGDGVFYNALRIHVLSSFAFIPAAGLKVEWWKKSFIQKLYYRRENVEIMFLWDNSEQHLGVFTLSNLDNLCLSEVKSSDQTNSLL